MKRFHVHVSVRDLSQSVRFYSSLFGTEPTVLKDDYAKWMLEDPRVNFAISQRAFAAGVDHLGLQVDGGEELADLEAQLQRADASMLTETGTTCCYAKSDKRWVTDPQGVAWEAFHTLATAPVYSESVRPPAERGGCCGPTDAVSPVPTKATTATSAACCGPSGAIVAPPRGTKKPAAASCCG